MGLKDYPKRVFFILGNEFCERFSFYGMKAILVIYLTRQLSFTENTATTIYHAFNMVCYFTPLFGAMLADGWLGKYWVILLISIVYCIGNAVMALTSFQKNIPGAFSALALIAIGTGGIKPCVSAFGGDQFSSKQVKQQMQFFSIFYMSINLGSVISTILTPLLRSSKCFGKDCYPLAFGVPAILMVVALVFYVIGTPWYTRVPPQGNVLGKMCRAIGTALKKKGKAKEKKEHWLDHAHPEFSKTFIYEVRAVLRVLLMFLPLPVFWALFDQQGSRWTLQAGRMNGKITNSFRLLPDQLGAINPILVIVFVPILESLIYPCFRKLRIPNSPLQRMGIGMFLAGLAFVISGFLQIAIDRTQPQPVAEKTSQIRFFNGLPCAANISVPPSYTVIQPLQATRFLVAPSGEYNATIVAACSNATLNLNFALMNKKRYRVLLGERDGVPEARLFNHTLGERPLKGQAGISVLNALNRTVTIRLKGKEGQKEILFGNITSLGEGDFVKAQAGDYNVYVEDNLIGVLKTEQGGVYTFLLQQISGKVQITGHQDISPNVVHMLWQLPQYITITIGECFFSITGVSFAYSQAPKSMKAVCQAAWNLTNAFGNLIVIIVAQAGNIQNRAVELFFFAGLMGVTLVVFIIMSLFYKYVDFNEVSDDDLDEKEKGKLEMSGGVQADLPEPPKYYEAMQVPSVPAYVPTVYTKDMTNGLPFKSNGSVNTAYLHDESTNM